MTAERTIKRCPENCGIDCFSCPFPDCNWSSGSGKQDLQAAEKAREKAQQRAEERMKQGLLLRRLREAAGLTQGQVAQAIYAKKATIGSWERGYYWPKWGLLTQVPAIMAEAQKLGIDLREVEKGKPLAIAEIEELADPCLCVAFCRGCAGAKNGRCDILTVCLARLPEYADKGCPFYHRKQRKPRATAKKKRPQGWLYALVGDRNRIC